MKSGLGRGAGSETALSGRVQTTLSVRVVRAAVPTAPLRRRIAASENSL